MKVIVNGRERDLKDGASLKDALKGEPHVPGTVVAIHKSTESLRTESDDFEVRTNRGSFCIHLMIDLRSTPLVLQIWSIYISGCTGTRVATMGSLLFSLI